MKNFGFRSVVFSMMALAPMVVQASSGGDALSSILKECASNTLESFDPNAPITVNGHSLNRNERQNVYWIKKCVVPFLPGTPESRAKLVAETTWWSLREGTLELGGSKPFRYSLCHENGGDHSRTDSPLYNCPTNIWQAGLASGQVANYSEDQLENAAAHAISELSPQVKIEDLLAWSARLAGFSSGTDTFDEIVNSSGRVRRSWLLRNPLIGFQVVAQGEVENECVNSSKHWCFGSAYDEERLFARNRQAMVQSVSD